MEAATKWDNRSIKPNYERLLATLAMLTLATSDQLNRALYANGSLTTTVEMMNKLHQERYVEKVYWRRFERGNPKIVWKLAARGHRYVKRHKIAPPDLVRPSDNLTHTRSQLTHTIRAINFLVHAQELKKNDPDLSLAYASEPTLRRHPLTLGTGLNQVTLYPDAFLWLTKHRSHRPNGEMAFAFELTRTTDFDRIRTKFAAWIQADGSEEYERVFGTPILVVVWVVDEDNTRKRDQLARLCWDYLGLIHQTDRADLFRFGAVSDDTLAQDFFFNPTSWVKPGTLPEPTSLLPMHWRPQ